MRGRDEVDTNRIDFIASAIGDCVWSRMDFSASCIGEVDTNRIDFIASAKGDATTTRT
ncbi:hypothetical protein ACIPSH_07595 [Streptomyces iakyrus]|uniref:hypothetical protein n=1 Tax=Streptomyces iakyrus TaxID=68219 RepID=UPI0038163A55